MSHKHLITEEAATAYQNWSAPVMEGTISSADSAFQRPPTAKDIQELQKQAYEEALDEGCKKGYQEGKKKAEEEFRQRIESFDKYLSLFNEPVKKLNEEVEQTLVALSLLIARHIIRRELKLDPGEIVAVVREAVKAMPSSGENARIFLHPEDAEIVRVAFSLKQEEINWSIEEDILLMRGDCRIETNSSLIDASVESRLSAIVAKMLGGERGSDE